MPSELTTDPSLVFMRSAQFSIPACTIARRFGSSWIASSSLIFSSDDAPLRLSPVAFRSFAAVFARAPGAGSGAGGGAGSGAVVGSGGAGAEAGAGAGWPSIKSPAGARASVTSRRSSSKVCLMKPQSVATVASSARPFTGRPSDVASLSSLPRNSASVLSLNGPKGDDRGSMDFRPSMSCV